MSDERSGVYATDELELTPEQEEQVATVIEFALEESDEEIAPELLSAIVERVLGKLADGHPLAPEADRVIERGLAVMAAVEEHMA